MAVCAKGFLGCPGRVPLASKHQCKSHRFYARMKSKMEAAAGEGDANSWIRAVNNENAKRLRMRGCVKECCYLGWLPSEQVIANIIVTAQVGFTT